MNSVIILIGKVPQCFCLLLSFRKYTYLELFGDSPIIKTKHKLKSNLLTWRKWTSCPQVTPTSFTSARLTLRISDHLYDVTKHHTIAMKGNACVSIKVKHAYLLLQRVHDIVYIKQKHINQQCCCVHKYA